MDMILMYIVRDDGDYCIYCTFFQNKYIGTIWEPTAKSCCPLTLTFSHTY